MSSKKSTTTNSTQSATQTPTVPTWISEPAHYMSNQISGLQGTGPAGFTPGESALQQQAALAAQGLTSSPYYSQAGDTLSNMPSVTGEPTVGNIDYGGDIADVTGQSLLTNLSSYYNPFKDQVLNPVLQDYDYQSGVTQAAQAAQAAKGQAFGGSRYGIQEAQTTSDLARGRATTEGGLLNSMYTQATQLSADDANRAQAALLANQQAAENTAGRKLTANQSNQSTQLSQAQAAQAAQLANQQAALQKAGLLTGLGTAQGNDTRSNLSLQDQIGAQQTDLENAIKQYPLQYQAQIESLLAGLNPSMYVGSSSTGKSNSNTTETSNPGVLDYAGMALQAGGLAAGLATGNPAGLFSAFRNSNPAGVYQT